MMYYISTSQLNSHIFVCEIRLSTMRCTCIVMLHVIVEWALGHIPEVNSFQDKRSSRILLAQQHRRIHATVSHFEKNNAMISRT